MNKKLSTILLGFSVLCSSYAQNINWTEIHSYVAWFNVYESPGLLSLNWNGKPALNSNGPGSLYSRTKFPPGSFRASISDSRARKEVLSDTLLVRESGNHFLITYGPPGECAYAFFHESDFIDQGNAKSLFIVNALGGGPATLSYQDSEGRPRTQKFDQTLKFEVRQEDQLENLFLEFETREGVRRREAITLPPFEELKGLIIVAYLDPDEFAAIRYAVIDPSTLEFLSADETASTEE
jgi:hypothetical protein